MSTAGFMFIDGSNAGSNFAIKHINIGNWDMDATASVSIAHGLTLLNVINVEAMVFNDAATLAYPAVALDSATLDLYFTSIDATNVNIARKNGGFFDSVDFDLTPYSRGHICVWYEL